MRNIYPHVNPTRAVIFLVVACALSLSGIAYVVLGQRAEIASLERALVSEQVEHRAILAADNALLQGYADANDELQDEVLALSEDAQYNADRAALYYKKYQREAAEHKKHHASGSGSTVAKSGWRTSEVSWYGSAFYGNTMAGGGTYGPKVMGVAHRTLPFGTRVQIQYRGKTITVPVVDRGPHVAGRELDLTYAAAQALDLSGAPTVRWRVR